MNVANVMGLQKFIGRLDLGGAPHSANLDSLPAEDAKAIAQIAIAQNATDAAWSRGIAR